MKIKISKTTTKEIEITFPHFRKSEGGNLLVVIFSETEALKVAHYKNSKDIEISSVSPNVAINITNVEVTRREFVKHYENTVDTLTGDFENVFNAMALLDDKEDADLRDNFDANEEPNINHINA